MDNLKIYQICHDLIDYFATLTSQKKSYLGPEVVLWEDEPRKWDSTKGYPHENNLPSPHRDRMACMLGWEPALLSYS